jgi:hypothetical protein
LKSLRLALLSLLAVVPCFWQARIQAGDLSSHVYNAWLAGFIRQHHPHGLQLVIQHTNVLFDELLGLLLPLCGALWAARWATALAVLIFVWGAFHFARSLAGRSPWNLFPLLLVLAYGWTFQMGLLNFYLSLGLSLWALSSALRLTPRGLALGALLLALACRAHSLPVAWSLGVVAYAALSRRLRLERLLPMILLAVTALSILLRMRYQTQWSFSQISDAFGADQAWLYDTKYFLPFAGLLFAWVALVMTRLREQSLPAMIRSSLAAQVGLLTAASIALLPTAILLPGFSHGLVYIAERMSLAVAVCFTAWLASVRPTRAHFGLATGVAVLFFSLLYLDTAALNRLEDQVAAAAARLPRSSRVVAPMKIASSRIPAALHLIDGACLGWCFSYSNYEPSTAQFRVRATAPNPYVTFNYDDAYAMQMGTYTVRPADLPLYQIVITNGHAELRQLRFGDRLKLSRIDPF